MEVFRPDKYSFFIGVPSDAVPLVSTTGIGIKDWVSITTDKPVQRFNFSTGIHGEPFVEMNRNSSRVFNLNILQTSPDIKLLSYLFRMQTLGVVGFPFTILNSSTTQTDDFLDINNKRQKSLYPVAYIVDEPSETFTLEGATWVYKLQTLAGATVYI